MPKPASRRAPSKEIFIYFHYRLDFHLRALFTSFNPKSDQTWITWADFGIVHARLGLGRGKNQTRNIVRENKKNGGRIDMKLMMDIYEMGKQDLYAT